MAVEKTISDYKWYIIAFVVVLVVVLLVVYFVGRKSGKSSVAPPIPGDNPNDPLTTEEKAKINSITDGLIADIYGWTNPMFRDWPVYNELLSSSNKIFVGVWNLYRVKKNKTLKADMQDESYWLDQMPGSQTNVIQLIYNRMNNLNLY